MRTDLPPEPYYLPDDDKKCIGCAAILYPDETFSITVSGKEECYCDRCRDIIFEEETQNLK